MSEAAQKHWVWDLYPLSKRSWLNQEIPNDGTPRGQTINVRRSYGRGRITYLNTGESHPYGTMTLKRPAYIPSEDDLALLRRCYPKDDPQRPSWHNVKRDLVLAGQDGDKLNRTEATVLLGLLKSVFPPPSARRAIKKPAPTRAKAKAKAGAAVRPDPGCMRLCADLREEAGALDVSPPLSDDPAPEQYAWIEVTAALLADIYGHRLARAESYRDHLISVKHASRSRSLSPEEKQELQRMAKGLFEVLYLAEQAVADAERWRSNLWERTKVLLPEVAKGMKVACVGTGLFPSDGLGKAVAEWRRIEVAAAAKRAAAGQKKWSLKAGTWTAAERAAWRVPAPPSATVPQKEEKTLNGNERRCLSPEDEASLLQKCLRRCCLCYALEGDDSQKEGQLAHLDHNRSNGNPDNFVFLCLRHHNSYDSRMSQAKNLTEHEVRRHRQTLYQAVEQGKVPTKQGATVLKFPIQQSAPLNINGNGNVVAGGDVTYTVNMPRPKRGKGRSATRPPIIPGTVSEDPRMVGYLNYLVRRYEKFKKWDCDISGQRMGYGVIRNAYKRDIKYELIHTPKESFEAGSQFLQRRIENTRLGRTKRGQKLYDHFDEFDEHSSNAEGLPQ